MGLPGMIARIVRPGMWRPAFRDSKSRFSLPSPLSVPLKAGAPQEVQVAVLGDPVGPYDPFSLDELLLDFGAMQILGACRVVDAFFEWGSHNTEWRLGRKVIEPADAWANAGALGRLQTVSDQRNVNLEGEASQFRWLRGHAITEIEQPDLRS